MFVKICGTTTEEDALLATALGADAVGFVFAPSPRQVRPEEVRAILRRLPHEMVTVGVFQNERPTRIAQVANKIGLHGVQLHGPVSRPDLEWIRSRVQFVIQAFRAGDPALHETPGGPADVVLIDSPTPGSGQVFDWTLAEGAPGGIRLMLAGGLNAENVGDAIRQVRPWGVDVVTGVEAAPGRKDPTRLRRFIEAAREASAGVAASGGEPEQAGGEDRPFDWMLDDG